MVTKRRVPGQPIRFVSTETVFVSVGIEWEVMAETIKEIDMPRTPTMI